MGSDCLTGIGSLLGDEDALELDRESGLTTL